MSNREKDATSSLNRSWAIPHELDQEAEDLFADATAPSPEAQAELTCAGRELAQDPAFQAELAQAFFVEDLLRAQERAGVSLAQLAAKVGVSRQYMSRIVNEDRATNFTIESMAKITAALGCTLAVRMLLPGESLHLKATWEYEQEGTMPIPVLVPQQAAKAIVNPGAAFTDNK